MADNTLLPTSDGLGDGIVTRQISHGGDTVKLPGSFLMGISGTEGSYTAAAIDGDAMNGMDVDVTRLCGQAIAFGTGIRSSSTPRVTIATDDIVPVSQSGTWTVGLSAAQTLSTVTTVATVTNVSQFGGQAISMGTGVRDAGTQRVTIATNDVVPASQSGTWNIGTVTTLTTCSTVTTVTTVTTVATVTNLAQMAGQAIAMGTGVRSAGTQRVTIATDDVVPASQSGTWNIGTVTTLTTCATVTNLSQMGGQAISMGTGVRSAGTQRVTIATDDIVPASQSGTWTVQPGNTANTTAWLVNDNPVTSGGLSISSFLSTAAVQSTAVKASPGQVYSLEFFNVGSTPMFVRLYNQTGAPAAGDNANILWRGVIPGNTAGAGFVKTWDKGLAFGTGIGMRCTGAIADTDATALAANTVIGNVCYK